MKLAAALLALCILGLGGCASFTATLPLNSGFEDDFVTVESRGGILVNRQDEFTVSHEWLDADNILHIMKIQRNTQENSDPQAKIVDLMGVMFSAVMASQGVPVPKPTP